MLSCLQKIAVVFCLSGLQTNALACSANLEKNRTEVGTIFFYAAPFGDYFAEKIVRTDIKEGIQTVTIARKIVDDKTAEAYNAEPFYQLSKVWAGILPLSNGTPDGLHGRKTRYKPSDLQALKKLKEGQTYSFIGTDTFLSSESEHHSTSKISVKLIQCSGGKRLYEVNYPQRRNVSNQTEPFVTRVEFPAGQAWKIKETDVTVPDSSLVIRLVRTIRP